jgi:hypothetical protein
MQKMVNIENKGLNLGQKLSFKNCWLAAQLDLVGDRVINGWMNER